MQKIVQIILLLFLSICNGQSTKAFDGRVLDENLNPMPGVEILIKGKIVGQTDFDGYYHIEVDSKDKLIDFSFTGCAPTRVKADSNCNNIEVIMGFLNYTCIQGISKKVVRRAYRELRNHEKEKFKNLSSIHQKAFMKGLFKTKNICGTIRYKYKH
jgi:hypothetical protein